MGDIFQLQVLSFMHLAYFSSYITPVVNIHHCDTCSVSHGDTFLRRKNILMVLDQFSTLEQYRGILCLNNNLHVCKFSTV